jgi:hypothetical protein
MRMTGSPKQSVISPSVKAQPPAKLRFALFFRSVILSEVEGPDSRAPQNESGPSSFDSIGTGPLRRKSKPSPILNFAQDDNFGACSLPSGQPTCFSFTLHLMDIYEKFPCLLFWRSSC